MINFFKYRWNISRIGFILILIGIFLTWVSFAKWIQILMFIPALVMSLFLYSYIETRRLKKIIKCGFLKVWENYVINIVSPNKKNFFFRLWYKQWKDIFLLEPDSSDNYFNIPSDEDIEIIIFLKGTFDIIRNVVNIWKISQMWTVNLKKQSWEDYKNNTFFFVRKYEQWDNISRLDSIKTALKNFPFIKSIINYEYIKNKRNKNEDSLKLLVSSNQVLIPKDEKLKWNILKWLLILINFIVIYIEWENLNYNAFLLVASIFTIFTVYKKKFTLKKMSFFTFLVFLLFINMFAMTIFARDMAWPCSVFFTQILILKQLFKDDREDWFLYIFLSLFVFVAVSLSSVALRFILFFLLYLIISVFLLTSVSGYMVIDSIKWAFWTKISNYMILKTTLLIFIIMTLLFFVLPHWNLKTTQGWTIAPTRIEQVTSFSDEINFKNIWALKKDNTKVIVVDNLKEEDSELLHKAYWRWERFYTFRNNAWEKSTKRMAYLQPKKSVNLDSLTMLKITFLKIWTNSIFFPNIPEFINSTNRWELYSLRLNNRDNSIFSLANKTTKEMSLSAYFDKNNQWKLEDANVKFTYHWSWAKIDEETEKLFSKFWSEIDPKIYNTPDKLVNYIKVKYWFEYSVDEPSNNIEDFLYGTKKWYCEFYASVLALTLQHFWYDATIVNWYFSWEWNSLANTWIIRWKDAHSWVEIYSDKSWQIYDATPSLPIVWIPFYTRAWNYIVKVYDYLDLKWYDYVVNYSWDAQKELLKQILNYKTEIVVFFISLIFLIVFRYFRRLYKINKIISYEDKLLSYISKFTNIDYPLEYLYENNENLVIETREKIFKKTKLSYKDYINLKSSWKIIFKNK